MRKYLSFVVLMLMINNYSFAQAKKTVEQLPIGVFDSGTGGLTVLEAILRLDAFNNTSGKLGADGKKDFETEQFQYLADQANMPYGNYAAANKTDFLREQIVKNLQFLLANSYTKLNAGNTTIIAYKPPVKMMVVACNTATAYALADLKKYVATKNIKIPIIGVINAGVKAALEYQQKNNGTIGVFATAGTVASNGYQRTLLEMASKYKGVGKLSIVSQGGVGLAESIDRDLDFFNDTASSVRKNYRGPSFKNEKYQINTFLLNVYKFDTTKNKLLCEYDANSNKCLDMQLNDPGNYVRYHLVSLLEKMLQEGYKKPLNTLILGCTHYPYMKDTIAKVLNELYNLKFEGNFRYRTVLAKNVELIDPAIETAKAAYIALRKLAPINSSVDTKKENNFFIGVPNKGNKNIELQQDGWFTYNYKYGRNIKENRNDIMVVPFDKQYISLSTYSRFKNALPNVYSLLNQNIKDLP